MCPNALGILARPFLGASVNLGSFLGGTCNENYSFWIFLGSILKSRKLHKLPACLVVDWMLACGGTTERGRFEDLHSISLSSRTRCDDGGLIL